MGVKWALASVHIAYQVQLAYEAERCGYKASVSQVHNEEQKGEGEECEVPTHLFKIQNFPCCIRY